MKALPNLDQVESHFDKQLQEHGATPRGADWNGAESQNARFDQLLKVVEVPAFSIIDYGCGYGALADYIEKKGLQADYYGFDILESAIVIAREVYAGKPNITFTVDGEHLPVCDYTVASGVFNRHSGHSVEDWTKYVIGVLHQFDSLSRKGFASNFLTKYSDADKMRPEFYYADPLFLFDYCKRNFSKNVALLHDYRLYDFTILVRKD